MKLIQPSFYEQDTVSVARQLLGCTLVRVYQGKRISGMIVETEAYLAHDPACHAHRGKTARNAALFGPAGHAYVYFIYGNHYCVNAVSRAPDIQAGGVLIRALEPRDGIEMMKQLRGTDNVYQLTNGPGKLAQALAIDRTFNGVPLTQESGIFIEHGQPVTNDQVTSTTRVGISSAQEHLWRFYITGNAWVSRP